MKKQRKHYTKDMLAGRQQEIHAERGIGSWGSTKTAAGSPAARCVIRFEATVREAYMSFPLIGRTPLASSTSRALCRHVDTATNRAKLSRLVGAGFMQPPRAFCR